ncbi:MAG: HAD-IA family hydrolase, partial [Pseudomonadota bacterium]
MADGALPNDSKIKGILFDFDGVLINSLPVMKVAFVAALREVWPKYRSDIDDLFAEYCKHLGKGFLQIMDELALPRSMHAPFRRHSKSLAHRVPLCTGASDLLMWCASQDLKLGIATGKDLERTLELLRLLGIGGFFHSVYASDSVENPKPHPEMALRFLEDQKLDAGDVIMIGDAVADIECGIAAGCRTAAAEWG